MRILIVEDDPAVLQAFSILLTHEGYTVATARNGAEAWKIVKEQPPDLIILDLWMPVMNGWEFLGLLRDDRSPVRDLPVIAVSADVKAASQDLPVQSFMTKPTDIDKLLNAVKQNLQTN